MIFDTERMVRFEADAGATGGTLPDETATGADASGDTSQEGDVVGDAGQEDSGVEKQFSQADLDRIVKDRLDRERKRAEEAAKKAEEAARKKAAEEQGEFKKLYEEERQKREEAEAERHRLEVSTIRARVGKAHNIPDGLIDRLLGETEEEITEDAKALAATLPKPGVNLNETSGTGNANQAPTMTDAQRIEFAARFGVNPEYVNPEYMKIPK